MRWTGLSAMLSAGVALAACNGGATKSTVSVDRGKQVSIVGGCHDCHTAGYNESSGKIDPATALKGIPVGWMGPWGTTYAKNLRITAKDKSENDFVKFAKEFQALPPMPWYNVHAMDESDIRSLYQYIKSLGDPGDQMPAALPPGTEPKTPYTIIAPPTMPKA